MHCQPLNVCLANRMSRCKDNMAVADNEKPKSMQRLEQLLGKIAKTQICRVHSTRRVNPSVSEYNGTGSR